MKRPILATLACLLAAPAFAADIAITSDAQVRAATYAAKPGDSLVFAAGTYAGPRIVNLRVAAPGITIKPAPGAKVKFSSGITFDGSAGFTVQDVEIDSKDLVGVMVGGLNPERIVLQRLDVHGAITDPAGIRLKGGMGVAFANCTGCRLEDSEIHHVGGAANGSGTDLVILNNRAHDMRGDGFHFGPVTGLRIEGNQLRDMYSPMLAHLDFIQIAGGGTDVTIRRNLIVRGSGDPGQGVFVSDGAYQRVSVEQNVIAGGAYHGILANNVTAGLVLRDNYVTGDKGSLDGAKVMTPWCRAMNSPGSLIVGNSCTTEGQILIPLPAAGDFSAALAQWAKITAPVDPNLAIIAGLQADAAKAGADLEAANARSVSLSDALASARAKLAAGRAALAD